jgi:predicted GH43/DUF377 family glycosyl hydrolase
MIRTLLGLAIVALSFTLRAQTTVSQETMERIYEEVKTPYKYGLVKVHPDTSAMVDSPTIFRRKSTWYMSYIVYDGTGYETWLAKSPDLLHWTDIGKILPFGDSSNWDASQAAGYMALVDYQWGGSYELTSYKRRYWMSYLGGNETGYEKGQLAIGLASTKKKPHLAKTWKKHPQPILQPTDSNAGFWENKKLFKSTVITDPGLRTGAPFVMYYNAYGDTFTTTKHRWVERMGMATSFDLIHWNRYPKNPVLDHHYGITGDACIQQIDSIYVMFYLGAFFPKERKEAFDRFACSYNLIHWTDWTGDDLIQSSEPYDEKFAHKPCVVKWNGVVYHFYCAVNNKEQRGIAVATSKDLGKSTLKFEDIVVPLER